MVWRRGHFDQRQTLVRKVVIGVFLWESELDFDVFFFGDIQVVGFATRTVDGSEILHHLGCIENLVNNGIDQRPTSSG